MMRTNTELKEMWKAEAEKQMEYDDENFDEFTGETYYYIWKKTGEDYYSHVADAFYKISEDKMTEEEFDNFIGDYKTPVSKEFREAVDDIREDIDYITEISREAGFLEACDFID